MGPWIVILLFAWIGRFVCECSNLWLVWLEHSLLYKGQNLMHYSASFCFWPCRHYHATPYILSMGEWALCWKRLSSKSSSKFWLTFIKLQPSLGWRSGNNIPINIYFEIKLAYRKECILIPRFFCIFYFERKCMKTTTLMLTSNVIQHNNYTQATSWFRRTVTVNLVRLFIQEISK